MSKAAVLAIAGLTALSSFFVGLVVAGSSGPGGWTALAPRSGAAVADVRPATVTTAAVPPTVASPGGVDFASVAARLNRAVVNVDTASRTPEDRVRFSGRYPRDDGSAPREGSGSGFIIDPSGFILTNHHVVAGADRVTVTLTDGRAFRATVVGVDPAIDVALLKVQSREALPVAPIGSSEALRVGEWVCAIGNPLGVYVHSVTVGVVSYLGRKLFDPSLDAYIQTDAAISFGNSGGPLINARGEVVGITTAISAQASNIGFAIPIAQVMEILPQLREHGAVARGYIGIGLTDLTPALRSALRIGPERGALVQDVTPDTPAEDAGLRAYDVVVAADGRAIRSDEELIRYISGRQPGTLAALEVWRDGDRQTVQIKLRDRPIQETQRARPNASVDARPASQDDSPLGLRVRELDPATAAHLRIPDTIVGVLVSDVDPAGPARLAQVRTNHVILEINRQRITTVAAFRAAVAALKPGEAAAVLIYERNPSQRIIATIIPD
ncbi:MAG TPA: trypsin-like peptidase domain-containing protein [Vicinamibacterales bacterium]|nr:trypsin-like peptidase domain-containing protein [Vicinamibacterales bacterium]